MRSKTLPPEHDCALMNSRQGQLPTQAWVCSLPILGGGRLMRAVVNAYRIKGVLSLNGIIIDKLTYHKEITTHKSLTQLP